MRIASRTFLCVLALFLTAAAEGAHAQQAGVVLHVTVTTTGGHGYASGIKQSSFVVQDEKAPQEITLFQDGAVPANIGIVMDTSETFRITGPPRGDLAPEAISKALSAFSVMGGQANDYFVVAFGERPELLLDWTRDLASVQAAVNTVKQKGSRIALYDACLMALDKLAQGAHRKRVLIVISGGALRPISALDAFGPNIEDAEEAWYDELLVSDETVVVIGYSYERGGTEVGLFRIDRAGNLRYRATYQLRSNDYYSSRNYASRLIGNKLIFYAPHTLSPNPENLYANFPAVRRWRKGGEDEEFRRIVPATRVYRAGQDLSEGAELALHTVTVCDLGRGDMSCAATALVGQPGSVFYVSPAAVYVWTGNEWGGEEDSKTRLVLYRMPLDGSGPSALRVSGSPVDQFSFLESEDGQLNVLVRSEAAGDRMWNAEAAEGDVALLRVPVWAFSDGRDAAPASSYRQLPRPQGDGESFQNRFVGDYLLYGNGNGWDESGNHEATSLYAVRRAGGETVAVPLEHGVDRIEALGSDAVVVGADK